MIHSRPSVRNQHAGDAKVLWTAVLALLVLSTDNTRDAVAQVTDERIESETEYYEPEFVRGAAREVMSRPEFRTVPQIDLGADGLQSAPLKPKDDEQQNRTARARQPSAAGSFLAGLFGGAVTTMVVLLLALVLGAIVFLIVLGVRRWEGSEKDRADAKTGDAAQDEEPDAAYRPGDRPADAWLAAARAAAAEGRYDDAIAHLLLGAMSHTERAGLIRPRRGLTYRDYLRAVPYESPWRSTLDRLIRTYAPVGFGRRAASSDAFEAVVTQYETALASEPTSPQQRLVTDAIATA